jgi:hypothetical protein
LDPSIQQVFEKIQKVIDDETLASQKVCQASTIKIEENKLDTNALKEQIVSISARIRSFDTELSTLKNLCTTDDQYAEEVQTTTYFLISKMVINPSNSFPSQYFLDLTNQIEIRMKEIKWHISGLETFFQAIPNQHMPTVIRDTLHSHQNSLIIWVAQITQLTEFVNELKKNFMEYRKKYFGDTSDPSKPKPEPGFKYVPTVPKTPQHNPAQPVFPGMNPPALTTQPSLGFTFGSNQPTATTTQPNSSGFIFGNTNQPSNSGFTFGSNQPTATTQPTSSGFTFGNTNQPANTGINFGTNQPNTAFSFGTNQPGTTTNQPANTGFSFGTNLPGTTNQPATTGFSFGNQPATNNQQATGFSFGNQPATTTNQPATGFSFGGTNQPASTPQSTGFSFGTGATTSQPTTGFNFGNPSTTTQPITTGFNFGGTNQPAAQPTSTGYSFTTNQPTTNQPSTTSGYSFNQPTSTNPGFAFGAQPTTTGGFTFGNPPTTGFNNFRS